MEVVTETIRVGLDAETFEALMREADRNLRPPDWQIRAMLRERLGLPFPYPEAPGSPHEKAP